MFKKVLSIVLTLALVVCLLPAGALPVMAETSGDYTYTVDNGKATVTGYSGDDLAVNIPATLGGYAVTAIGAEVFTWMEEITSVEIPEGVTSIGGSAFEGCSALASVELPDSVTVIGDNAFAYCMMLRSVELPYGVTTIGSHAFHCCAALQAIVLPDSVTSIGESAFGWCDSLSLVTLSNRLTRIENFAFWSCYSLREITIPDSVTQIGEGAFSQSGLSKLELSKSVTVIERDAFWNCPFAAITVEAGNPVYHSAGNCLIETQKKTLLQGCANSTIPSDGSVIRIGEQAFYCLYNLTSMVIPEGVTTIDASAFVECENLTSITLPRSVSYIDDSAFVGCNSLETVYYGGSKQDRGAMQISMGNQDLVEAAWQYTAGDEEPDDETYLYAYIIVDGKAVVTGYGGSGTDLTMPSTLGGCYTVVTIERMAFYQNKTIQSVVIPQTVQYIGEMVFCDCTALKAITIPSSVDTIGNYAFMNCTELTTVFLTTNTDFIGDGVFNECPSLTDVYYDGKQSDRDAAWIGEFNEPLLNATWHYAKDPEPVLMSGDVNNDGKVNNKDLGLLLQYLNGWDVSVVLAACDVTGDQKVNNKDLGLLLQYLNGWDVELAPMPTPEPEPEPEQPDAPEYFPGIW